MNIFKLIKIITKNEYGIFIELLENIIYNCMAGNHKNKMTMSFTKNRIFILYSAISAAF